MKATERCKEKKGWRSERDNGEKEKDKISAVGISLSLRLLAESNDVI